MRNGLVPLGMSLIATTPTPCKRLGARRTHTSEASDRRTPSRSRSFASSHFSRTSPSAPVSTQLPPVDRAPGRVAWCTSSKHAGARQAAVASSASTASGHRPTRQVVAVQPHVLFPVGTRARRVRRALQLPRGNLQAAGEVTVMLCFERWHSTALYGHPTGLARGASSSKSRGVLRRGF